MGSVEAEFVKRQLEFSAFLKESSQRTLIHRSLGVQQDILPVLADTFYLNRYCDPSGGTTFSCIRESGGKRMARGAAPCIPSRGTSVPLHPSLGDRTGTRFAMGFNNFYSF